MGLGASLAVANDTDRTPSFTFFADSFDALMSTILAPAGEPITPPIPRPKPDDTIEAAPEPPAPAAAPSPGIVAQCGYATVLSGLAKDGTTPVFRVSFAEGMADEMVAEGCASFFQGCNVCTVRYDGCSAAERDACNSVACLEKTCERNVVCSAKSCEARGRQPTCESRLTRTQCIKTTF